MRPCVRYRTASANLSAAWPQEVSLLGTTDILNSGLYSAASNVESLASALTSTNALSPRNQEFCWSGRAVMLVVSHEWTAPARPSDWSARAVNAIEQCCPASHG